MVYFKIIMSTLLLSFFASIFVSSKAVRDGPKKKSCYYKLNQRKGRYNPVITSMESEIIRPTSRTLRFGDGDAFMLQCPSTDRLKNSIAGTHVGYLKTKCINGKFYVGGNNLNIYGVSCNDFIQPRITKRFDLDNSLCAVQGADGRSENLKGHLHTVEIGFELTGKKYFKMIEACIDELVYGTLWTRHIVNGPSIFYNDYSERPYFLADNDGRQRYFNFTNSFGVDSLYRKREQVQTIISVLGTNMLPDGTTIFDTRPYSTNFIERGHLSPKGDFVWDYEQSGTFFFINVAPQFAAFNRNNWEQLESSGRDLAEFYKIDLEVTTGTFGIQTYPRIIDGLFWPMYLKYGVPEGGYIKNVIPIPLYFWKVIFDRENHLAAAFLGKNDVHWNGKIYNPCPNRCAEMLSWIRFDTEDVSLGHVTCCDLESFSRVVPNAPDYRKNGKWPSLLTH